MNIIADENIPLVGEAFSPLGKLSTLPGRSITNSDLHNTDILLVRSVTRVNQKLLENTPVRFVASATAGFNHVDVDYLSSKNIGFARAPGSNALSAAEYVIASICHWSLENEKPLNGLKLGIIGCGNVGSRVAKLAAKLGLHCVLNDPPLEEQGGAGYDSIDAALGCDIVTLHVPLEESGKHATRNLLNAQCIEKLKPEALLINAARGEVLDESALLKRMNKNNDLSLIIDVWLNEPTINRDLLSKTTLGTAHIAGYSYDGKIRGTEMIYQALCQFLGINTSWQPQLDAENTHQSKSYPDKAHDLRHAILSAYDIKADDQRLKKLLTEEVENPGDYFDQLRKNYPIRREYSPSIFSINT